MADGSGDPAAAATVSGEEWLFFIRLWRLVMAMKRLVAALALGVAAAGGVVALALPASAEVVTCGSTGASSENRGTAWARDCSYSADRDVRLLAPCIGLPQVVYSPWVSGPFAGVNFETRTCAYGAYEPHFEYA
ncbi:hypothetical protein D5S17_18900 [Pseudonocardiaceae bacterium YIM PH 21723]|nr:hypothetical protein D5S17_18900 [Pseudonocardiaceae bacterium YIM PH 21723]